MNKDQPLWIPGPCGQLEANFSSAQEATLESENKKRVALLCHPHPKHGGNMHNKVITTIARSFLDIGDCVIRFNYRGVGKSEGVYGHFSGEVEDTWAVMQWVNGQFPGNQISICGFSFGGAVAIRIAQLVQQQSLISSFNQFFSPLTPNSSFLEQAPHLSSEYQLRLHQLITIAPALYLLEDDENKGEGQLPISFDFPWLLVQGWKDEVIKPDKILTWCQALSIQPELWCLPEASHFFHGQLVHLKKKLIHYLTTSSKSR